MLRLGCDEESVGAAGLCGLPGHRARVRRWSGALVDLPLARRSSILRAAGFSLFGRCASRAGVNWVAEFFCPIRASGPWHAGACLPNPPFGSGRTLSLCSKSHVHSGGDDDYRSRLDFRKHPPDGVRRDRLAAVSPVCADLRTADPQGALWGRVRLLLRLIPEVDSTSEAEEIGC